MEKQKEGGVALFGEQKIRRVLVDGEWWFSVVDVVKVLTDSSRPDGYWVAMKARVKDESEFQLSTICRELKLLASDNKLRATDCSNTEGIFRIIQSIPSPKAEPFKRWLAKVGYERVQEIENPELAMDRMKAIYEKKGYSKDWIDKRARGIAVRHSLTDEWRDRGANNSVSYAILTNEIMEGTFGLKVNDYKKLKGLERENLRDHMDDMEIILTMLGEATTTKLTQTRDSQGFSELKNDANDGGGIAGATRKSIEKLAGEKITSPKNFLNQKIKKIGT